MTSLYDPIILGDMNLGNRVFMAPLTRNRATPVGVPWRWAPTYYSQRASAGLIVTEATQISPMGKGYINTPGIHSEEQIAGWKPVVDAVRRSGGRIFLQLWHVGRLSHSSLLPGFASPVAPSAIRARSQTVVQSGFVDVSEPRALSQYVTAMTASYGPFGTWSRRTRMPWRNVKRSLGQLSIAASNAACPIATVPAAATSHRICWPLRSHSSTWCDKLAMSCRLGFASSRSNPSMRR